MLLGFHNVELIVPVVSDAEDCEQDCVELLRATSGCRLPGWRRKQMFCDKSRFLNKKHSVAKVSVVEPNPSGHERIWMTNSLRGFWSQTSGSRGHRVSFVGQVDGRDGVVAERGGWIEPLEQGAIF